MTRYIRLPHSFRADERGNVATIFALTSVVAVSLVGGAVDFGRVFAMKAEMQATLDAAALAGGAHYAQTNDLTGAKGLTTRFFQERYTANTNGSKTVPKIEIVASNALITAKATVEVPTPFLSFMLSNTVPVEVWTSTSLGGKKLEIALMFDVTGSMEDPTSGGSSSKIVDAKAAAQDLINIVMPDSGAYATRMSLVPFSQKVKLDADSAAALTGGVAKKTINKNVTTNKTEYSLSTTEFSWKSLDSCKNYLSSKYYEKLGQSEDDANVSAAAYCQTLQDNGQTGNKKKFYVPDVDKATTTTTESVFSHYEYINPCFVERNTSDAARKPTDVTPISGEWNASYGTTETQDVSCPPNGNDGKGTLIPLTSSPGTLRDAITALETGGATAGHIGTAWSLYTISPKWASIWKPEAKPADYDDTTTMKAAVLMTDGAYNSCNGGALNCSTSDDQAIALCTKMKDEYGITVYTIGFGMSTNETDPSRLTLVNCASPGKYYFPYNGDELRAAFADIGAALVSGGSGPRLLPSNQVTLTPQD